MRDLVLPAFAMDCRDWLVITPSQAGLPEEVGGAPLLAVLSTAVVGPDDLRSASGVLTVGLLDADVADQPVPGSAVALELVEDDWSRTEDSHALPAARRRKVSSRSWPSSRPRTALTPKWSSASRL